MQINISFESTSVQKTLSNLTKEIRDFRRPLDTLGVDLLQFYGGEVFTTQGGAINQSWKRLADSTLLARARRSGYYRQAPASNAQTLVWTGRMQKGFKKEVSTTKLRIFNPVPYFKYHQKGGKAPKRAMLAITPQVVNKAASTIEEFIEKSINKSAV